MDTDQSGARAAAGTVRASAHEALVEMETLIDQLQAAPMEVTGFVDALRRQCDALGYRTGAEVSLTIGTLPTGTLVPGAYDALYRFAQEALHNAGRHARASKVLVHFGVSRKPPRALDRRQRRRLPSGRTRPRNGPAEHGGSRAGARRRVRHHQHGWRRHERAVRRSDRGTLAAPACRRRPPVGGAQRRGRIPVVLGWRRQRSGHTGVYLALEFLNVFGIAVGIGVVLIVVGALVRAAIRFDVRFLNALSRHADLDRHR